MPDVNCSIPHTQATLAPEPRWRGAAAALCTALGLLCTGCADTAYLLQSVEGHFQVLRAAQPVEQWLRDEHATTDLKERLRLAQRIREFAVSDIHLPDNPSYHRYADLRRRFVVWNVVAAPAFSLTPRTWCFPVAGCVGYRGYFDEAQAQAEGQRLRAQELEVVVHGVSAYSTLGWMNWAGGDPLLNTFIHYPEGELARMLFHELAHQVVYVGDDTVFNESFASAVERLATQRWLTLHGSNAARTSYAELEARRRQFRALTRTTRHDLATLYAQDMERGPMAAQKTRIMQEFRARYAQLKAAWGGFAGFDPWVAHANNAAFAAQAAYDEWVPAFEALFQRHDQDWGKFYDAVRRLAALPKNERIQFLKTMNLPETHGG